jgi:Glycosyl hydrolases family 39
MTPRPGTSPEAFVNRILAVILGVMMLAAATPTPQGGLSHDSSLQPPDDPISIKLFGLHIHRAASTTPWPNAPFGTWRLWDAYAAWPNLESERGKWNFETLDKYVSLAEKGGVDILLPLGLSPGWASARPSEGSAYSPGNAAEPKNLDDWRDYVRTVAGRYKGRVSYYEIWNEPNLKQSFSGSPEQMIALVRIAYETLKQVDPAITVVSPSPTGIVGLHWLDQFLQKGGGAYVDVIGYHLYVSPQPPEAIVDLVAHVREVMATSGVRTKPLWDTETGWRIENHQTNVSPGTGTWSKVLSDTEASAYVARSYILSWAAGVSRFYWYAWDNGIMGLTEADGKTLKPSAMAYVEAGKWLVGSRMISCNPDAQGTWIAQIARPGGYRAWIVWSTEGSVEFDIPAQWGAQDMHDLSGGLRNLKGSRSLRIDQTPVMVEGLGQ